MPEQSLTERVVQFGHEVRVAADLEGRSLREPMYVETYTIPNLSLVPAIPQAKADRQAKRLFAAARALAWNPQNQLFFNRGYSLNSPITSARTYRRTQDLTVMGVWNALDQGAFATDPTKRRAKSEGSPVIIEDRSTHREREVELLNLGIHFHEDDTPRGLPNMILVQSATHSPDARKANIALKTAWVAMQLSFGANSPDGRLIYRAAASTAMTEWDQYATGRQRREVNSRIGRQYTQNRSLLLRVAGHFERDTLQPRSGESEIWAWHRFAGDIGAALPERMVRDDLFALGYAKKEETRKPEEAFRLLETAPTIWPTPRYLSSSNRAANLVVGAAAGVAAFWATCVVVAGFVIAATLFGPTAGVTAAVLITGAVALQQRHAIKDLAREVARVARESHAKRERNRSRDSGRERVIRPGRGPEPPHDPNPTPTPSPAPTPNPTPPGPAPTNPDPTSPLLKTAYAEIGRRALDGGNPGKLGKMTAVEAGKTIVAVALGEPGPSELDHAEYECAVRGLASAAAGGNLSPGEAKLLQRFRQEVQDPQRQIHPNASDSVKTALEQADRANALADPTVNLTKNEPAGLPNP